MPLGGLIYYSFIERWTQPWEIEEFNRWLRGLRWTGLSLSAILVLEAFSILICYWGGRSPSFQGFPTVVGGNAATTWGACCVLSYCFLLWLTLAKHCICFVIRVLLKTLWRGCYCTHFTDEDRERGWLGRDRTARRWRGQSLNQVHLCIFSLHCIASSHLRDEFL